MTTLTITPDIAKKRLKLAGTVASGEKVAVTVVGFGMMIYDPSGVTFQMDSLLPQLREAFPFLSFMFGNFIWSAFALLTVNGITNMVSIYLIHKKQKIK